MLYSVSQPNNGKKKSSLFDLPAGHPDLSGRQRYRNVAVLPCDLLSLYELLIFTSIMPTLFIVFGLRFFFYSNEHLHIHVHVKNADGEAKFEVEDVKLIDNKELKNKDIALAISIIE